MKKILTIQDISCFGKCSITIALPVISAMGIETVILPTAVLSTHTMFKNFTVTDLSNDLLPIANHWKNEGITFDAIYTGYLGTVHEIETSKKIFEMFKDDNTKIFIDPVMADNGKLYPAFNDEYVIENTKLCSHADYIMPNITEACFMTGTKYADEYDEKYIHELMDKLSTLGSKYVILTGVSLSPGKTGVYARNTKTSEDVIYQNDKIDASYHGTGDLFSSTLVGCIVRDMDLYDSMKTAADYTAKTIDVTLNNADKPWYGVDFEATLPDLISKLK